MSIGHYFIVDGIGGCGKSTVVSGFVGGLRERGFTVVETREPGGTPAAEKGRKILFDLVAQKLLYGDQQMAIFNLLRRMTVVPAAIFILDISVKKAMLRRKSNDPFDDRELNYWEAVVENYRALCKNKWGGMNWVAIDAERPQEEVLNEVMGIALGLINC